ncbi:MULTISPECIES: hypothetical protein [unclassified Sphingomonas]|uniref:hypothetical protein n=1 Tax=unclassified Sphingomonas TaxID=196159 RepID=UPI0012E282FA|nr:MULTISPECIES: hypothetical protein [unclassified Sphingomonas]
MRTVRRPTFPWRLLGWGGLAALLLLPWAAGAPWTPADYGFAAAMFAALGGMIELAVRTSGNPAYRAGAIVAIGTAFLLLWSNAAVGLLGDGDNPANAMFLIVLAIAILGGLFVRFGSAGMVRVMQGTALAQLLAGTLGWTLGWAAPGGQGVYEVTLGVALFGTLWLVAAGCFARAARHSAQSRTASPSI